MAETFPSIIAHQDIGRGACPAVADLIKAIRRYIDAWRVERPLRTARLDEGHRHDLACA